jgi:nucleoside-diphosphate-sugar epimerase
VPDGALAEADALVHCAWDFVPRTREEIHRVNVEGSMSLLRQASEAGVARILSMSSMSAYAGTGQLYGQAKLALEEGTVALGGVSVRPGLVYGDNPAGMAGALMKLTSLPIVPVVGSKAYQFPVHEDDLADTIVRVLDAPNWMPEVFGIAQPDSVRFRELLGALAALKGRRPRFVDLPWQLAFGVLWLAEHARLSLPLRSDSVLGLVRPAPCVPLSTAFPTLLNDLRTLGGPR